MLMGHEQKWNPKPLFLPKRVEERLYFYENKAEWGKTQKYRTINVRTKLTTFITCLASLFGLFVGKAAEKKRQVENNSYSKTVHIYQITERS